MHTPQRLFWQMSLLLLLLFTGSLLADERLSPPGLILQGVGFEIGVDDGTGLRLTLDGQALALFEDETGQRLAEATLAGSRGVLELFDAEGQLLERQVLTAIPAWLSLVPALTAIGIALVFRQVIAALFLGILLGGWIYHGMSAAALFTAFNETVSVHLLEAASDSEHMAVVLFCLLIGGMVGIISRNGGTQGIAARITRYIRNRRQAQATTGLLGLAIFFDDYANALIVGNTMRNIFDRLHISRAKLAYIVDCTAAPVSAVLLVTTWIGFQVGLIQQAMSEIDGWNESAYSVFIQALPYNFYPFMAVAFVFLLVGSRRDFGPMLVAERRALAGHAGRSPVTPREAVVEEAEIETKPGIALRASNAVVPMLVLVAFTIGGIYTTGAAELGQGEHDIWDIFGEGDAFAAMMWGSLAACITAVVMTLAQRLMTMNETTHYWFEGVKSMLLPLTILMMAWALANVNATLGTSDFLIAALGEALSPQWLPAAIFTLAAFTAFATGSSWGVMGIMMPLTIPLAWAILDLHGLAGTAEGMPLLYASVAGVLAGAVWGDHCSPLAESTLLAAMASGCDLIEHVRTQLPYALLVGVIALVFGSVAVGHGLPWWLGLGLGLLVLALCLRLLGKRAEDGSGASRPVAA
ncbi:Na+/H+ antiporter NhaC family protein [Halomonas sp. E14]|uniref:Na+/H+ antiporter NhaC family protein n=1 Tax=Halomonas sp. E14 TaxID=3397245 RepID=UPI00403E97AF